MADDEEAAAAWLATDPDEAEPKVLLSDWTPEREVLERISDGINAVVHAVVASAGAKPGTLKPGLRPVTAFDRVREEIDERRRSSLHRSLMTQLGLS